VNYVVCQTARSTRTGITGLNVMLEIQSGTAGMLHGAVWFPIFMAWVPDKVIQAILRHSNVSVTLEYYVKSASADVMAAMGKFEEELAVQTVRDSDRTPKLDSGATLESVN
jgi:hypothetical protein